MLAQKYSRVSLLSLLGVMITSCISPETQHAPNLLLRRDVPGENHRVKVMQVFFDGTANKWSTRTNVRRRFEAAALAEDPSHPCLYIDGVGNNSVTGAVLGHGLKPRVIEGYKFISDNYQTGSEKIRIFGFSRGAFQARVLTGLMAHCGVPQIHGQDPDPEKTLAKVMEEIWDYNREFLLDINSTDSGKWEAHLAANQNLIRDHITRRYPSVKFTYPSIQFMGLWDTVPGLQFARIKNHTTMDSSSGQRYKVRPYPNVEIIAHALALDESRKQFMPLLVGGPINQSKSTVYEVWFPGAHSDIGGGYRDSNDMAGVSFNWIDSIMLHHGIVPRPTKAYPDASFVQHHPENSILKITGVEPRRLPDNAIIDATVFTRARFASVPNRDTAVSPVTMLPYRPIIHLQSGKTIAIQPTPSDAQRRKMLGSLKLNDALKKPDAPVELKSAPLNMEQMFNAGPVAPQPQEQQSDQPATPDQPVAYQTPSDERSSS